MLGRIHSLESFGTVDGPGTRFVVFFQGCPMRCAYCHNPDTWEMNAGTPMEASYIIEQYERNAPFYQNGGGITCTGGEPLMQIDFLIELFTLAKQKGIHTCLDTSGIAFNPHNAPLMEKFDKLMPLTNLVMLDIKHIDPEKHKELTSQPNDGILAFAEYLDTKDVDIWIRHVVVPGYTDSAGEVSDMVKLARRYPTLEKIELLPFHKLCIPKYEALGIPFRCADIPECSNETINQLSLILQ